MVHAFPSSEKSPRSVCVIGAPPMHTVFLQLPAASGACTPSARAAFVHLPAVQVKVAQGPLVPHSASVVHPVVPVPVLDPVALLVDVVLVEVVIPEVVVAGAPPAEVPLVGAAPPAPDGRPSRGRLQPEAAAITVVAIAAITGDVRIARG
jgi:hypothetical protein